MYLAHWTQTAYKCCHGLSQRKPAHTLCAGRGCHGRRLLHWLCFKNISCCEPLAKDIIDDLYQIICNISSEPWPVHSPKKTYIHFHFFAFFALGADLLLPSALRFGVDFAKSPNAETNPASSVMPSVTTFSSTWRTMDFLGEIIVGELVLKCFVYIYMRVYMYTSICMWYI